MEIPACKRYKCAPSDAIRTVSIRHISLLILTDLNYVLNPKYPKAVWCSFSILSFRLV